MSKLFKNYSLSIVLAVMFLGSWLGQYHYQWLEFQNDAKEHSQEAKMDEFVPAFWSATFENWQSEFLQVFTFVTLTSFLIHKGSPESKDGDEQMQQQLNRIEAMLKKKR